MKNENGKYFFGNVKVGPKGQIVIPAEARKVFNIKPGDDLMIIGDIEQGIAIPTSEKVLKILEQVMKGEI